MSFLRHPGEGDAGRRRVKSRILGGGSENDQSNETNRPFGQCSPLRRRVLEQKIVVDIEALARAIEDAH
jgi:hypothetical protein